MTTFRYVALAVLAVLAAAYGYYWLGQVRSVPLPLPQSTCPMVNAEVLQDGAVAIGGERFDDPVRLKAKLREIRKDNRGCGIALRGPKDLKMDMLGKAVALLEKSGEEHIGFITEPRTAPEKK